MKVETYADGVLISVEEVPDPEPADDPIADVRDAIASATTVAALRKAMLAALDTIGAA